MRLIGLASVILLAGCQPDSSTTDETTSGLSTSIEDRAREDVFNAARPMVSPDGQGLTFLHVEDDGSANIYVSRVDGSDVRRLSNVPGSLFMKSPVWSPDGTRIAFHVDFEGHSQLFIIDADRSNQRQLTDRPGWNVDPFWTTDGENLLFNYIEPGGSAQIHTINPTSGELTHVHVSEYDDWYPRPTPDGGIVVTSNRINPAWYDTYVMDADGTNVRLLNSAPGIDWAAVYSPDGTRITFLSNRDDPDLNDSGDFGVYVMDADGTNVRRLTEHPGQELFPIWYPDSRYIVFGGDETGQETLYKLDSETGDYEQIMLGRE